jgi:hypothetical protein
MPIAWLKTAEKQMEKKQRDAAGKSLKKGVAALERMMDKAPITMEVYAQASTLAADLGDKETFDVVVASGMTLMGDNRWHRGFSDISLKVMLAFSSAAAELQDKDHRIFKEAEKILANYTSAFRRSELLCSLAVSRAKLGMHEESLRLLKFGASELLDDRKTLFGNLIESIVEAKSYK